MKYLAHIDCEKNREQTLKEHLTNTAELAETYAKQFGMGSLAYRSGILHDIGKYSEAFQRRLMGSDEKVDHSTAGAKVAYEQVKDVPSAFCISGHHSGLPNRGNPRADTVDCASFCGKMRRVVGKDIEKFDCYKNEITIPDANIPNNLFYDNFSIFIGIHMLYSCLVDADFLDTEEFMSNGLVKRGSYDTIEDLLDKLEEYIAPWWSSEKKINNKRCEILRTLIDKGKDEKGLFTLTVPTGGGKTVSSVAFALNHVIEKDLKRIIYVVPFTSIIEQTQAKFEEIFGSKNVVAHYSTIDYSTNENGNITDKRYLATENWDSPIVITTTVQFFESVFSNRSSKCRKLHNIANSVIIFDEAQMMPVPYLEPCVMAISQFVKNYGCSAVLCTATQPALNKMFNKYLPEFPIRELAPNVEDLYDFFQRVTYENIEKISNEELVDKLNWQQQVLCIVNNRKQAQELYHMLDDGGKFHLSTTMYPLHRRNVLDKIRSRLENGQPCRVISTSLIEAGVDIDFPVVYRSVAGLDSIIQAGGRCNREGKSPKDKSMVYIFEPENKSPGIIQQNISASRNTMRKFEDISSPNAISSYFNFLYYMLKGEDDLDKKKILKEINSGTLLFKTISDEFKIIDNLEFTIYIPKDEGKKLIETLKAFGAPRSIMRKLGQYSVGVYTKHLKELIQTGGAEMVTENTAILTDLSLYDDNTGLSFGVNEAKGLFV